MARHGTYAWALETMPGCNPGLDGWAKDRGEPNSEQEWFPDAAYIGLIYAPLGRNWHPPSDGVCRDRAGRIPWKKMGSASKTVV